MIQIFNVNIDTQIAENRKNSFKFFPSNVKSNLRNHNFKANTALAEFLPKFNQKYLLGLTHFLLVQLSKSAPISGSYSSPWKSSISSFIIFFIISPTWHGYSRFFRIGTICMLILDTSAVYFVKTQINTAKTFCIPKIITL